MKKNFVRSLAGTQVYSNRGKGVRKMRCYPESIKFYNRALKYYREISDKSSVAHTLSELGELYFELNDYKSSKQYFSEGLELSKEINDVVDEVRINTGLAKLYVKFADTEKAENYLVVAEELAKSRKSYKELSIICKIFSENFSISGKVKESKLFLEKHFSYLKQLNNIAEENKVQAIMLGHIHAENNMMPQLNLVKKAAEVVLNFA